MKNLIQTTNHILGNLKFILENISDEKYATKLEIFSGSSLGQHIRHIIEFYQCLIHQLDSGTINYDKRIRNILIEEHPSYAVEAVEEIKNAVSGFLSDKNLTLEFSYDLQNPQPEKVDTTLSRELVYNTEHAIHHFAILKIGIKTFAPEIQLPKHFGVASSTVKHQESFAKG